MGALPQALTCQDLSQKRSSSPLKRKSQLEKNNPSRLQFFQKCDSENWPVIIHYTTTKTDR